MGADHPTEVSASDASSNNACVLDIVGGDDEFDEFLSSLSLSLVSNNELDDGRLFLRCGLVSGEDGANASMDEDWSVMDASSPNRIEELVVLLDNLPILNNLFIEMMYKFLGLVVLSGLCSCRM